METLNVLIVDDETIITIDLADMVRTHGFNISGIAYKSKDAIKFAKEYRPDLILMDINFEDKSDGIDTIRSIQEEYDPGVIYITAYSDEETVQRAILTDPLGYIIKPFDEKDIFSILKLAEYKIRKKELPLNENMENIGNGYFFHKEDAKLYFHTHPIELTQNELTLIKLLLEFKGGVLPFEVIDQEIWPAMDTNESKRRTLIYRLNSKLEHKIIRSIRKIGCKLDLSTS